MCILELLKTKKTTMIEFNQLIGEGTGSLSVSQMSIRAVIIFLVAIILIRLAGRRSFGQKTAFDNVIIILLGAVLSRSVIGSDNSFYAPIAAAFVISVLHRSFGWLTTYSDTFGKLVKGNEKLLFQDGEKIRKNMRGSFITDKDLLEGIRKELHVNDGSIIKEAWLERDGSISVIKK